MNKIRDYVKQFAQIIDKKTFGDEITELTSSLEELGDAVKKEQQREEAEDQKKVETPEPKPAMQQTNSSVQVSTDQRKLKEFIDSEIHYKIKSVLKEQVVKLFSDYAQKREKEERK